MTMYTNPGLSGPAVLPSARTVSQPATKTRVLFGREDLDTTYRRAKALIIEHRLFRMIRVEARQNGASLIICNLWRIDVGPDKRVVTLEHDLVADSWFEVNDLTYWPAVPISPIYKTRHLTWWRDVARGAIWKALIAAGYGTLPKHLTQIDWLAEPTESSALATIQKDMSPGKMAYILIGQYQGENGAAGYLDERTMCAGARALRAAIFEHLLDTEVMSALLAIDFNEQRTLRDYLRDVQQRDDLLRIARERRNLLPLLPHIKRPYWSRSDLFARQLWVRDGRRRTLVEYQRFNEGQSIPFQSFDSRAAFRWLCRSPISVVRHWTRAGGKDVTTLENLARANLNVRLPAVAWCDLVTRRHSVRRLGVSPVAQQLYRAYALFCAALWKEEGFQAVKIWLNSSDSSLSDIADWLLAEGIQQGYPQKNATWTSLLRHSQAWHLRMAQQREWSYYPESYLHLTWHCQVPAMQVADIRITPLDSAKAMIEEGVRQHHCIASYVQECADGHYRAYSLVDPSGVRTTLGLCLDAAGRWQIDQHRSCCNGRVSTEMVQAGQQLLALYQQTDQRPHTDNVDYLCQIND